ncbi:autotransporter secretion inner membrane protein TamB [Noviherbaspirillum humi]|uniref:Autotransporter secretion inner membrane protein TamB n=1 Tax=Noviherbaspirillum humi TaxID=1688639 RepID=A0A239HC67_9BURK|nr:translocation/assembly module TamB domain-containing protein [Noviherbaspirillum humi]SNS78950.1 autotransporter secretion inner membrane protein TamB [Noviherbaspirillum humi]
MASEAQAPAPKPPSRRHGWRTIGLLLLGLLLAIAIAVAWMLGTEHGAGTALGLAQRLSNGAVRAEGVHGALTSPLRIDRITIDTQAQTLVLQDVRLDWFPRALLQRELHVQSLHAGRLDVTAKAEAPKEETKLPDAIGLPFDLKLDEARIDSGSMKPTEGEPLLFGPAVLGLTYTDRAYRLQLRQLALKGDAGGNAFGASLQGDLRLAAIKPYALQGAFNGNGTLALSEQDFAGNGRVTLGGSLEDTRIDADLAAAGAIVKGEATLHPFAESKLGAARLAASGIDLSRFKPDLPGSDIALRLESNAAGSGTLSLDNPAAGPYDRKRLPLSRLELAFTQQQDGFLFDRIDALMGAPAQPAGSLRGSGSYRQGKLALKLATEALDLKRLDSRMQTTRLAGNASLSSGKDGQEFALDLSEPLDRQRIGLSAHGVLAAKRLDLDRVRIQAGSGTLEARARADLEGKGSFAASGRLNRFRPRDLGRLAQLPEMLLNGEFSVEGERQPALLADANFSLKDSQLAGQPLRGQGRVRLQADSLRIDDLALLAGANRLQAKGALDAEGGKIDFNLDAPRLEQFGRDFAGSLRLDGQAAGSFRRPQVQARFGAGQLRLPGGVRIDSADGSGSASIDRANPLLLSAADVSVAARGLLQGANRLQQVDLQARFAPQPEAPLHIALAGRQASVGGVRLDSLNLQADGTTGNHQINAIVNEPGQVWRLAAHGGLSGLAAKPKPQPAWQGTIERFEADGRLVARSTGPAPLLLSADSARLENLALDGNTGRITIERFQRDAAGIATRGSIRQLRTGQILKLIGSPSILGSDLMLSGDWNIDLGKNPSGSASLRRDGGDVVVQGSVPVALGLRQLEAAANLEGGRIAVQLRAEGERLGRIAASGSSLMESGTPPHLAPNAPLSGKVELDLPSIGWAAALLSPTMLTEGRLQGRIDIGGTLDKPLLAGKLTGNGLHFLMADTGIDFRGGTLDADFDDSRLRLNSLRFAGPAGKGGPLVASGTVDFASGAPAARIDLRAERFALLDRSDRRLSISGSSQLGWSGGAGNITGAFTVDSGYFDIGNISMPKLSDDVVIVGRDQDKGKTGERRGLPAAIDVSVGIGSFIQLKGRGLDGQLAGDLRFASQPGEPLTARGILRIVKGTFSAYGRELAIERGLLRFSGPLDNPGLDILAMRRGQQVEAGVSVGGTVLSPRVTLVSEPTVPDAEKLSWLVLGRGLASAGQGDVGALQSAAGALLSQGAAAGVGSQLANAFGLDEVNIGRSADSATVQERIVTLGKQLSSRLFVSFRRGLETANTVLHLRYVLSPRLTLEGETGSRSALSLFYNFAFD